MYWFTLHDLTLNTTIATQVKNHDGYWNYNSDLVGGNENRGLDAPFPSQCTTNTGCRTRAEKGNPTHCLFCPCSPSRTSPRQPQTSKRERVRDVVKNDETIGAALEILEDTLDPPIDPYQIMPS